MATNANAAKSQIGAILRSNVRDLRNRAAEDLWVQQARERGNDAILAMPAGLSQSQREEWRLRAITTEIDLELGIGTYQPTRDEWMPLPTSARAAFVRTTGLSEDAWQKLEANERDITASELVSIAAAMHVDVAYLLSPPIESLVANTEVRCGDFDGARATDAQSLLLWLRGLAPLPGQDVDVYLSRMSAPYVHKEFATPGSDGTRGTPSRAKPDGVEHRKRHYWRTESGYSVGEGTDSPSAAAEGLRLLGYIREALQIEGDAFTESAWTRIRRSLERLRWHLQRGKAAPSTS